jgi:predicted PurR-regulated permease PerM
MIKHEYPFWFFILAFLVILYLAYHIFRPFLMIFLWAIILVTTFQPVYRRLVGWTRGRETLSALIMVGTLTLLLILPVILLVLSLADQSLQAYNRISTRLDTTDFQQSAQDLMRHPAFLKVRTLLGRFVDVEKIDLKNTMVGVLEYISTFLVDQSQRLFASLTTLLFDFLLLVVATYYLFRNGESVFQQLRKLSPMDPDRQEKIISRFTALVRATLLGNFVTAIAQGTLGGLAFLIVGLPSPVLWGAVMSFLALVPVVGAYLVYVPAAVYLLSIGSTGKAVLLMAWGTVGGILTDNVLKPQIIKGGARIHPVVIFFSILGGLSFFGFSGLVLGPLVTGLALVFLEIYREEFREQLPGTMKLSREYLEAALREKPDDIT